jgi:hypothetical protein
MNSYRIYCHPSTLWYHSYNDDDYDDDEKESEELVKKQFSRYDVSKEKPDDNLHPMSRFIFLTVKNDPKLGGDMGKYYICSYSSFIHYFIFSSNTMLF